MEKAKRFNQLLKRLNKFSSINPDFKQFFDKFGDQDLTNRDIQVIYECLGQFLLQSEHTLDVVQTFREDILNIFYCLVSCEDSKTDANHLLICRALAKTIEVHPDIECFAIKYFKKYPSPFDRFSVKYPARKKVKFEKEIIVTDLEIVSSCYTFLKHSSNFFRSKWSWSDFINQYGNSEDPMVKWYCYQCMRIVTGMNEAQFNLVISKQLPEEIITTCLVNSNDNSLQNLECSSIDSIDISNDIETPLQVSRNLVNISGIYLPVCQHSNFKNKLHLVEVQSTKANLYKIALGIAANRAVCLQGCVGSGKSCLIEYLAEKTGRVLGESFIKVQLGDQTDGKMLLGSYRCTDVPGEFVWQPGVLTQAVSEGSWLLLEDIDLANMDIASILNSLLENQFLTIPGYRDSLPISPGFQLFLTHRLLPTTTGHYHKRQTNATVLLEKNVLQINIDPLTPLELQEIIQTNYPVLITVAKRMVEAFLVFYESNTSKRGRLISTRDLFKWCSRAAIDFDVTSQNSALNVLQDGIDVFTRAYSSAEERLNLARQISTYLGIINEKANYFCNSYKPNLCLTADHLKTNRISLERQHVYSDLVLNFCFTRPAACLLEGIMCSVKLREPVLLVGETGTGKTSAVQYLAHKLGHKLVVINMNQQSDSADLLGGYKPVDMKFIMAPIKREFERIFTKYFCVDDNKRYLENINSCFNTQKWNLLIQLMKQSYISAMNHLTNFGKHKSVPGERRSLEVEIEESKQISRMDPNKRNEYFLEVWTKLGVKLQKLELQLKQKNILAFSFIEGSLVKAVENGNWVLLDEINLANAETLECLSGLLEGTEGSLNLLERGDKKPIRRHPNFILFACMNPSTDVGKRDLPVGLRNRFTEFFCDELTDKNDLILLVESYLKAMSLSKDKLKNIVKFYLSIRNEAEVKLCDDLGHKPHFSLRTLCRALMIAARNPCGVFIRSLYEAFCMSFLTQLDSNSYDVVQNLISKFILGIAKDAGGILRQPIPKPTSNKHFSDYLQFEGYWVPVGNLTSDAPLNYILTKSVRRNLRDLVRVVSIGRIPVLLQGDTSVGKTSLIKYLAAASRNKCVRINNHEHTDLQEYVGSYVADISGKLVFREGLLVEAMRRGYWIILDELNLAPTDVLEALNRVLDDNRELFIPETQETVKAHPNFMLFATQNPPGAYGGRKMLSRAFRNRFVELHFNEIPPAELEVILHECCELPVTYSKRMVDVMMELQKRRRGSAAFAGKHGFMTLRDLFRWGERYRLASNRKTLYDWDQHLVDEGYLLLAGRVRKMEEKNDIADALHKHMRRKVVPQNLFTLSESTSTVTRHILESLCKIKQENIVWTFNMRQLAVLTVKALEFHEPVLLVGETGGGKTTVCKIIAENNCQELFTVNCHMHTEGSDFIGGLRPVRDHSAGDENRLFEWVDGPLIKAMQSGGIFLADEISLADDSVLERLNSLLEPERSLLLAEKGSDLNNPNNSELITAHSNFHFIGTMNPGGDYGKKELSPALRNRFTEIWCESCTDKNDLIEIIERTLKNGIHFGNQEDCLNGIGRCIMDFIEWFKSKEIGKRFTISIRDILTWVNFINCCATSSDIIDAYIHGACLTFLDSLGSGITNSENSLILDSFQQDCMKFLKNQFIKLNLGSPSLSFCDHLEVKIKGNTYGIEPFFIPMGTAADQDFSFMFNTTTCSQNALRVLRGLQLNKAILLEGSPGVGKTSLVTALARATRNQILRINLSNQTDISDLFGADLPVEGGSGGQFAWRDGPFLRALKQGHWILLDELNLASQSVLEGLNACLDHRGEIFIPELGKTFHIKPGTRLFACQNPLREGGSRRGLPQSFLNRFSQVHIRPLKDEDLLYILSSQFPQLSQCIIKKMITFNSTVVQKLHEHVFGHRGSPWEFNLRDLTRWCEVTVQNCWESDYKPQCFVQLIYSDRMRTVKDRDIMKETFEDIFECNIMGVAPTLHVTQSVVNIGDACLNRQTKGVNLSVLKQEQTCLMLRTQLPVLRSLTYCVQLNWMAILVGSSGTGKTSIVRTLADLIGKTLHILPVTSAMDTTDILGGFEQTDYTRHLEELVKETELLLLEKVQELIINNDNLEASSTLHMWEKFSTLRSETETRNTLSEETQFFLKELKTIKEIWKHLLQLPNSTSEIEHLQILQKKGGELHNRVTKEGNLNAGGKFEWVDSVLVKCLQDGSWLLIDNVNLCSPAVLDRLNAVLEPNGVLSIGERGIKENGELVEIKPHKDFRLFLTMDPKNGEISRAMRNRGVEIYMLNPAEIENSNLYDMKALINQAGLTDNRSMEILLKMHDFITDLTLGEKPNLNHLLRASFLLSQQLLRGKKYFMTFYNTLIEVYYKNRLVNEFQTTNVPEEIHSKLKSLLESEIQVQIYSPDITLKTRNLSTCSEIERIKQQTALLRNYLETSHLWQHFLINSCSVTSLDDMKRRYAYLQVNLSLPSSKRILENIQKLYLQNIDDNLPELPFDLHWIPDSRFQSVSRTNKSNRFYLLMYFVSTLILLENDNSSRPILTLEKFLHAIRSGKSAGKVNDILEEQLLNLLVAFDQFFQKCMETKDLHVDDEEAVKIILLLHMRFTLLKLIQIKIHRMTLSDYKMVFNNLQLHYKWFLKHTVKPLTEMSGVQENYVLTILTKKINNFHSRNFSLLRKISKCYQKFIKKPPPLINETQIYVHRELQQICCSLDLCNIQNDFRTVLKILFYSDGLRRSLIDVKAQLDYDFTEVPSLLLELKELHTTNKCIKKEYKSSLVEILPILDHFARIAIWETKLELSNGLVPVERQILTESLTVPINLLGTIERYRKFKDARLQHELKSNLFYYLIHAVSLKPYNYLDLNETEIQRCRKLSETTPILSYLLTNLLVWETTTGDTLKITNLGDYRENVHQYKTLNELLWKNLPQISRFSNNYESQEVQYVTNSYRNFIKDLSAALNVQEAPQDSTLFDITSLCIEKIAVFYQNSEIEDTDDDENTLTSLLQQCQAEITKLSTETTSLDKLNTISNVYYLLSYIKILFTCKLPLVDRLAKIKLKKQYYLEKIDTLTSIKKCYQLQNEVYSCTTNTLHAHVPVISKYIEDLSRENAKLGEYVAVRPKDTSYSYILQEISHPALLPQQIIELYNNSDDSFTIIQRALTTRTIIDVQNYEAHYKVMLHHINSYENFVEILNKHRSTYPDIIEPLLSNFSEFLYGIKLKASLNYKILLQYKNMCCGIDLNRNLLDIMRFPVLHENQKDYKEVVKNYMNDKLHGLFKKVLHTEEDQFVEKRENFRLLKCSLLELYTACIMNMKYCKTLEGELFRDFDRFLKVFLDAWKRQQEELEQKQKEEESLYKIKKNKSEETEIEEEFKELFPSFHDMDFSDIEKNTLDDEGDKSVRATSNFVGIITQEDVKFVSQLHTQLLRLCTRTEWLNPPKANVECDFVTPVLQKCKLFKFFLEKYVECLDYTTDAELCGSLNVLIAVTQRFGDVRTLEQHNDFQTIRKPFNFYRDSKVDEIKGCYHILEELRLMIVQLLQEWPDHPTLQKIQTVIERLYSFELTSPLSRFLTGFEILLAKCHEWEQNAHAGVSLAEHIQNLVQQIISWRKLEMNMWKDSLNNTFDRMNEPFTKWWLYLYEIMLQCINETNISFEELVKTLQQFISVSNLAEYESRLSLLFTFHCHAVHLKSTKATEMFVNVLWNLHEYYKQFIPNIQHKIKELRTPIEKKLKEYVKIVKWKDISYWAIKETCEKTHKTLYKHIREYQDVLKVSATPFLFDGSSTSFENIGIWDRPQRHSLKTYHYTIEAFNYMAKSSLSKKLQTTTEEMQGILVKAEKYFNKSRILCRDVISSTNYPSLIQSLDGFITEVIDTSNHLQNLEVDKTLPKSKQISQAKGILQQKKKALSDLYKTLTELGLSYRVGLVQLKNKESIQQFLMKPIDLSAGFQHVNYSRNNKKLLTIWDGCEIYYTRSLARLNQLYISAESPAKDLGIQNLERLRGYSKHLMTLITTQKMELIESSGQIYHLKFYTNFLSSVTEENDYLTRHKFEILMKLLTNIVTVMEQYKIIVHTCPEHDLVVLNRQNCLQKISDVIESSQKLLINLDKFEYSSSTIRCAHLNYIPISNINQIISELNIICVELTELHHIFGEVPLTNSCKWLISEIKCIIPTLEVETDKQYINVKSLRTSISKIMEKLLRIIQNIYKKYKVEVEDAVEISSENEPGLKENHLKGLIIDHLSTDVDILEIKNFTELVQKMISQFFNKNVIIDAECKIIISHILPLLQQIILLYQYFLTQQISAYRTTCKMSSILSNIFINLATKGFCVPPEFSEELSNEGQGHQGSGLGLGEGEGERDVSDRIESEDQLEDAQPAGQEKKKEEEKDCKEEEKGIEMSEDFDGKLQDVEKGKDGNESESDQEADEQMGETEKGADQLDQQIWGTDDEDSNESGDEEHDKEEEKGSKGEKEGQSEMGAKDDSQTADGDQEDQTGKDKKEKKKEEINEMDERELDDEQVDPYHGNQPQYPEPEVMELPEDLQLDEDMENQEETENEKNPFDIDTMKENMPPETYEAEHSKDVESKEEKETSEQDSEESEDEFSMKETEDLHVESEGEEENADTQEQNELKNKEQNQEQNVCNEDEQSALDDTKTTEESQAMDVDNVDAADNVQTNPVQNPKATQANEQVFQEDNPDKEGVGQSQMEESTTGHKSQTDVQKNISSNHQEEDEERQQIKRKPGQSDSQRSLGDTSEPVKKKLKTVDVQENDQQTDEQEDTREHRAEMYQHIKDAKDASEQMLDTATKEQAKEQDGPALEDNKDDIQKLPDEQEEDEIVNETVKQQTEKLETEKKKQSDKGQHPEGDIKNELEDVVIDGEIVSTATVPRGGETTHHTQYSNLNEPPAPHLSLEVINQLRAEVEQQLSRWNEPPTTTEAEQAWQRISAVTSSLAQGLSEQLRLVLEPTQTSHLKGDYRTGRRINMRKVIPYIASQFRKDKIWLRRTKPSKREYQIALAIDDSSSMSDNHSKELAFESVALISKALTLLESGQLAVLSFGEITEVLHKLTDTFTEKSGSKLLQKFQFAQKKTCVAKLVEFATEMLNSAPSNTNALIGKLLIIVSDGRGVFSEGESYIQQAVRRAKLHNIFMVFFIIDNPKNRESILDIRKAIFKNGQCSFKSYMDSFPFPFYIILRDINSLPNVLSDALRQWFEIVSNVDKQ